MVSGWWCRKPDTESPKYAHDVKLRKVTNRGHRIVRKKVATWTGRGA